MERRTTGLACTCLENNHFGGICSFPTWGVLTREIYSRPNCGRWVFSLIRRWRPLEFRDASTSERLKNSKCLSRDKGLVLSRRYILNAQSPTIVIWASIPSERNRHGISLLFTLQFSSQPVSVVQEARVVSDSDNGSVAFCFWLMLKAFFERDTRQEQHRSTGIDVL